MLFSCYEKIINHIQGINIHTMNGRNISFIIKVKKSLQKTDNNKDDIQTVIQL